MMIKEINSEEEYQKALARLEIIWGASLNTSEGQELDALATLITKYEKEQHKF